MGGGLCGKGGRPARPSVCANGAINQDRVPGRRRLRQRALASVHPRRGESGPTATTLVARRLRASANSWRLVLITTAALVFAGAVTAAAEPPVRSLLEMRHQDVVVQHFDISCGAAALATVLDYQFSEHLTEKQVAEGLIQRKEYIEHPELLRAREGFSLLDMKRFVDKLGFMGIGYGKLELKDLIRLAPIIVAVRPVGYNHFVVFRGQIGDKVLLADPAFGNRTMSVANFERQWIDFPQFGRVGFIVTRSGTPAPPGHLGARPDLFVAPLPEFVRQVLF
jgi:uncharacterized protein